MLPSSQASASGGASGAYSAGRNSLVAKSEDGRSETAEFFKDGLSALPANMTNSASAREPAKRSRYMRKREEILNAAGACFNRYGLRDATLAVIASDIGLNLKSLRYYFKRKEDLVAAAFLRSIKLHRELIEDALDAEGVETRVCRFIDNYFALQARVRRGKEPEFVHFGDLRALTEPHAAVVWNEYNQLFRLVRTLIRAPDTTWNKLELNAKAHMLISQLLWSVVWLSTYLPEDFPRVAQRMADILLHGISAERGKKPLECPARESTPGVDKLSQETFLRAATALINEQGYRGASVDRISSLLNVTKGAFYHHNETRDGLVLACFERTFDEVRKAQNDALRCGGDGLAHVTAAMASLVCRQTVPEGQLLRTAALTSIGPELRHQVSERMSCLTFRFADMLNDGMADGSVRICDVRIAAEMVTATVNSAEELQRWVPAADFDNAAELYVRPLIEGLLTKLNVAD